MARTITVKGCGNVSAKPDYVILSMNLESQAMKYEAAMEMAAENIAMLNQTLSGVGFEKEAVKTTNFNVHTDYERQRQWDESYKDVFCGYVVTHNLKVEFDFDSCRLSEVLSAVGSCIAHPQLNISFTVKDATAINEEMLQSAAKNARRKAEILCSATGASLGTLLAIDYNWGELSIYSETGYRMADECLSASIAAKPIEIEPDDIDVSDTATFVWEIV